MEEEKDEWKKKNSLCVCMEEEKDEWKKDEKKSWYLVSDFKPGITCLIPTVGPVDPSHWG